MCDLLGFDLFIDCNRRVAGVVLVLLFAVDLLFGLVDV